MADSSEVVTAREVSELVDLKRSSLEVIRGIAIASEGPQHRSEDREVTKAKPGYVYELC